METFHAKWRLSPHLSTQQQPRAFYKLSVSSLSAWRNNKNFCRILFLLREYRTSKEWVIFPTNGWVSVWLEVKPFAERGIHPMTWKTAPTSCSFWCWHRKYFFRKSWVFFCFLRIHFPSSNIKVRFSCNAELIYFDAKLQGFKRFER